MNVGTIVRFPRRGRNAEDQSRVWRIESKRRRHGERDDAATYAERRRDPFTIKSVVNDTLELANTENHQSHVGTIATSFAMPFILSSLAGSRIDVASPFDVRDTDV